MPENQEQGGAPAPSEPKATDAREAQEQISTASSPEAGGTTVVSRGLFIACFAALVATSFAFIIRVMVMDQWQIAFGLSETQKGEIFGAGMYPFGISIVLFSLIIDRFGYGRSMIFAFVCHLLSTIILVTAGGYWALYIGSFLNGLAAGTVEAVINPAVASMYPKQKTKMLTILHAGWPGGMVIGGLLILFMGGDASWKVKVAVILLPTIAYGILCLKCKFPVSERVAAGVPYKDMLKEAGALGCLIILYMICMELSRLCGLKNLVDTTFFDIPSLPFTALLVVATVAYYFYAGSLGRPMYIFLLLVMILLAITELGTDAWIKELMTPAMTKVGLDAGLVLVYTATIMMILRFCIGPILRALRPLGVLLVSAIFATTGLYLLAGAEGFMILIWATVYGTGQCFFWPVTLGLVAEQFPKGGALTLNVIAGVGMLGVGILGAQLLGFWQDTSIDKNLQAKSDKVLYERLMDEEERKSIFGSYRALDANRINEIRDLTALYDYRQKNAADAAPGQPAAGLAENKVYQTLVRNAYNHLARPESDAEVKTHAVMEGALAEKGLLVDAAQDEALAADKAVYGEVTTVAKRTAMRSVAILPTIMALCYLGLIFYFKSKGGYQVVELTPGVPRE